MRKIKRRTKRKLRVLTRGRECGSCSECCTVLEIRDIEKPAREPCRHLRSGGGCGIYGSHPAECSAYKCLWLVGFGETWARPDRSGVLMSAQRMPTAPEILDFRLFETRAGAFAALGGRRRSVLEAVQQAMAALDGGRALREQPCVMTAEELSSGEAYLLTSNVLAMPHLRALHDGASEAAIVDIMRTNCQSFLRDG